MYIFDSSTRIEPTTTASLIFITSVHNYFIQNNVGFSRVRMNNKSLSAWKEIVKKKACSKLESKVEVTTRS